MNATELHTTIEKILPITGLPCWQAADDPDWKDTLAYIDDATACDDEPFWAIVPADDDSYDIEDCCTLEPEQAATLIKEHFRSCLLAHGWQVQVTQRQGNTSWRLADCLSPLDGGGDRLDADYPNGSDEFAVICKSILVIAQADTQYRSVGL